MATKKTTAKKAAVKKVCSGEESAFWGRASVRASKKVNSYFDLLHASVSDGLIKFRSSS